MAHETGEPQVANRLDAELFPHFAPLLEASQDYALHSGCRFTPGDFDEILCDLEVAGDPGSQVAAKLRAAKEMEGFRHRLEVGDEELVLELEQAARMLAVEGTFSAMAATCRALNLWPPLPPPRGVSTADRRYLDLSAPLPVIAQRAYNEQVHRRYDVVGGVERVKRQGRTASFLIDFALDAGVSIPPMPEEERLVLEDFVLMAAEHQRQQRGAQATSSGIQAFFCGLPLPSYDSKTWWGAAADASDGTGDLQSPARPVQNLDACY